MSRQKGQKVRETGSGHLYEAYGAFHVRYYSGGKQKSVKLCDKDAKHPNKECKAVRDLCREVMVKARAERPIAGDMLISEFWEHYCKWAAEVLPNGRPRLKANTLTAYKSVYKRHLKDEFGKLRLSEYDSQKGDRFLDKLSSKLGLNSLRHIKAVAYSIFKRAVREHRIKMNPWHEVTFPDTVAKPAETDHYTLAEYDAVINALKDDLEAKLAFSLAFYCGLRIGEIQGLRWEDFKGDLLSVQRSFSRGQLDLPKTESSAATVQVPAQAGIFLTEYHEKKGKPKAGWLFPSEAEPEQPRYIHRDLIDTLEKAKIEWKGWHAARRGIGTLIVQNTGNAALAQQHLRHKNMSTTLRDYKKELEKLSYQTGITAALILTPQVEKPL